MADTDGLDVDLLLSSLRADESDVASYFEVLATKLEGALKDRISVERSGRRRVGTRPAHRIVIATADHEFAAELSSGSIVCSVRHQVRGITLRTDEMSFDEWLSVVVESLASEADRSASTRTALEGLLA